MFKLRTAFQAVCGRFLDVTRSKYGCICFALQYDRLS